MALPSSGIISASMINDELKRPTSAPLSLDDVEVRKLAGRPSGPISFSDFWGKSAIELVLYRSLGNNLNSSGGNITSKGVIRREGAGSLPSYIKTLKLFSTSTLTLDFEKSQQEIKVGDVIRVEFPAIGFSYTLNPASEDPNNIYCTAISSGAFAALYDYLLERSNDSSTWDIYLSKIT